MSVGGGDRRIESALGIVLSLAEGITPAFVIL